MECDVGMFSMCMKAAWLTPPAIWCRYEGHKSGAFYDRSHYIPQAYTERESEGERKRNGEPEKSGNKKERNKGH